MRDTRYEPTKLAIDKTLRRERMAENLDVFDFNLDDDDMAGIAGLETGNSSFFSHLDPAMAKSLHGFRLDI